MSYKGLRSRRVYDLSLLRRSGSFSELVAIELFSRALWPSALCGHLEFLGYCADGRDDKDLLDCQQCKVRRRFLPPPCPEALSSHHHERDVPGPHATTC